MRDSIAERAADGAKRAWCGPGADGGPIRAASLAHALEHALVGRHAPAPAGSANRAEARRLLSEARDVRDRGRIVLRLLAALPQTFLRAHALMVFEMSPWGTAYAQHVPGFRCRASGGWDLAAAAAAWIRRCQAHGLISEGDDATGRMTKAPAMEHLDAGHPTWRAAGMAPEPVMYALATSHRSGGYTVTVRPARILLDDAGRPLPVRAPDLRTWSIASDIPPARATRIRRLLTSLASAAHTLEIHDPRAPGRGFITDLHGGYFTPASWQALALLEDTFGRLITRDNVSAAITAAGHLAGRVDAARPLVARAPVQVGSSIATSAAAAA